MNWFPSMLAELLVYNKLAIPWSDPIVSLSQQYSIFFLVCLFCDYVYLCIDVHEGLGTRLGCTVEPNTVHTPYSVSPKLQAYSVHEQPSDKVGRVEIYRL